MHYYMFTAYQIMHTILSLTLSRIVSFKMSLTKAKINQMLNFKFFF